MSSEVKSDPNVGCIGFFVLGLMVFVAMAKGCSTDAKVDRLLESNLRLEQQLKERLK